MKASSICGSDIRAIYRAHLGKGPEGYRPGIIAGHEPCGQIVRLGSGARRFREGDRVAVYHISGCGVCYDCRMGYQISCASPSRGAYGWQRDGGHAAFLLAEERDLVRLPDSVSYQDGALCACGFGTCYEATRRVGLSGRDRVLVVGLGPVGLAALMLAKAQGAPKTIGVDVAESRVALARRLNLADVAFAADDEAPAKILEATDGHGAEVSIDCSGSPAGRLLALRATRQWGRCVFVGEGNSVTFDPSPDLIHKQITLYGSWVTSLGHMEELVERLALWGIHPHDTVTHTFPLDKAADAYALMDEGHCGKVVITWPE
jgi:threonine dehydrogenase-like Zn-dependent dehydrogenase